MMNRKIYDDAFLIKKSLLQDLPEDELKELKELLKNPRFRDMYAQLNDPVCLEKLLLEHTNYSGRKGFMVFKQRRGGSRRVRILRWVTTVAAVCLIALGVSLWFLLNSDSGLHSSNMISQNIPAGGNRAILTFMDGRTMELSEMNRQILKEDGVNIEYKDGAISYDVQEVSEKIVYNELKVPKGGECVIRLDDGTTVWVNADTELKYPIAFVGKEREVFLEGEAFFDVSQNAKPFIVKTSFGDVRVLGTAFGVNAYSNENQCYTTLVRGKVSVKTTESNPLIISPGEQAVTFKNGKMEKRTVNIEEFVGWKDGLYVFEEKPLINIMKTLERWYNISILFEEESLMTLPFTGNLKRYDDINVFLDALTRTGDLKYRVEGSYIILYK